MKGKNHGVLGLACGALWAASACAQSLSATAVSGLSFGSMAVVNTGTVTVGPSAARSASPGIYLLKTAPGAPAQLTVKSSTPNLSYAITLPTSAFLTAFSGGAQMKVSNFTSSLDISKSLGNTGVNGSQTIYFGGTLQLGFGQAPGNYTGNFDVTFNYQ